MSNSRTSQLPRTSANSPAALLFAVLAAYGCGGSAGGETQADGGPIGEARVESLAPLCSDIESSPGATDLFSHGIVDPSEISNALVFGDMEPSSPQEIINFELGFYIPGSEVPLTSPGKLFIESIDRSYHDFDDVTDWGLTYHVCSYMDGSVRRAAVSGNFAHIATLSAPLMALFMLRDLPHHHPRNIARAGH